MCAAQRRSRWGKFSFSTLNAVKFQDPRMNTASLLSGNVCVVTATALVVIGRLHRTKVTELIEEEKEADSVHIQKCCVK